MQDVLDKPRRGDVPPAAPAAPTATAPRRRNTRARWELTARIIALSLFCLLLLFPFVWLVSQSLKDTNQYFAVPFEWIPSPFRWENFTDVIFKYEFLHYIGNSLWLAGYAVVVNILASSFVAYGFSRFRFPGRNALFMVVLATMMLPGQVMTISLYRFYREIGWIDTFYPLLIPKLFGAAFEIFLFRQFFMSLPREIDEAARIDGCGTLRTWWHIILPQSKPVIIVVAVFTFLGSWRELFGPLIYLTGEENRTLPLGLLYFTSPFGSSLPMLMAAIVISLIPPVVLYALGQKYIDKGVAIAEIK
ncbi:carbohydrate ABC transporter permease [Catellatospora tritici]|uniref:carbohydrate ABC transporter permease n=1 Tax=Catellatospora tritici TaxID=2851566 RepID=UPI001C2CF300|nr:carbohydrate ABC transporter permease [Catellatospora tritici]MBV1855196.1 carbohydrate ABC transporter permease [Catellatospora tritici]